MSKSLKISVVIPAFNEENSIGLVVAEIPKSIVDEIVVVNNNSTDETAKRAQEQGATVLDERRKGYGWACLKGIDYLTNKQSRPDVIVFLDGDLSDYPNELPFVVAPIIDDDCDMVIGSRALGSKESGSMTLQQIFGNKLAVTLIKLFYHIKFTDLGPFRAIKLEKLISLNMKDKTYGWTVEMQVKAAKKGLKCCEVPVNYRKRIGFSKVSGTLKGTILAGYKILFTVFKYI